MKHTVRLVLKYLLRGIAWGCAFFVFFCLFVFYWQGKEFLISIVEHFPRHAAGTMLVGIGYGSMAILYEWEGPSLLIKAAIHFFVGTGVFFFTAVSLEWIPLHSMRPEYILLEIFVSCVTFVVIWLGFYLLGCREARKINGRLQELEKEAFQRTE